MVKNPDYILKIPQASSPERLDKLLSSHLSEISRSRLKALILEGAVSVDDVTVCDPAAKVAAGQVLTVTLPPLQESLPQPEDIPLEIVFEDQDLIVINKPAGLVVHPAPGNFQGTLVNALLAHCGEDLSGIGGVKRPGIVHRLDKDTSGLMVVAKNDASHQHLSQQFADRTLSRTYNAVVWRVPNPVQGRIEGNIGRSFYDRKKMALVKNRGKSAVTHYKVIEAFGTTAALVECQLESGRTHQIRVHMSAQSCPVIGDKTYGRPPSALKPLVLEAESLLQGRHALHAVKLRFSHPKSREPLTFTVPLPPEMEALVTRLQNIRPVG